MSRPDPATVSTEVEDHQVLATVEARGLSIAIAVEPWIDHQVVDDLRRELHLVLDVGPEEVRASIDRQSPDRFELVILGIDEEQQPLPIAD